MKNNKRNFLWTGWGAIILAHALFVLSFTELAKNKVTHRELSRVQSYLQYELKEAQQIAERLLKTPAWETLPKDVISPQTSLFAFQRDSMIFWIHDITVGDQELLDVTTVSQYLKLGSSWYVAKAFEGDGDNRVLAAVLIKSDYTFPNEILVNRLNPDLHFPRGSEVIALYDRSLSDEEKGLYTVRGLYDEPLFVLRSADKVEARTMIMRWTAIILLLTSFLIFLHYHRKPRSGILVISAIALLRFLLLFFWNIFEIDIPLFSVELCSDNWFLHSLGDVLIHAFFLFLIFSTLYIIRSDWRKHVQSLVGKPLYNLIKLIDLAWVIAFLYVIYYVIRSLALNSTIVLDPFRLVDFSIYSVVAYFALALLFSSFFILCFLLANNHFHRWLYTHNRFWSMMLYVAGITLFTLFVLSKYINVKEKLQAVTWAEKLVGERDPAVEMALLRIEPLLSSSDEIVRVLAYDDPSPYIHQLIAKKSLYAYMRNYDIQVTVCAKDTVGIQDCRHYFEDMINEVGERIHERPSLYFLNDFDGRISYLMVLNYLLENGQDTDVYIHFESKLTPIQDGYPDALLDTTSIGNIDFPSVYSFAVYKDQKLTTSKGNYDYPVFQGIYTDADDAFKVVYFNNYTHFFIRINEQNVVVLSRPVREALLYASAFSYLFIFFLIIIRLLLYFLGWHNYFKIQHNTFRSRITVLLLGILIVSMFAQGVITIWFGLEQFGQNNLRRMENKLSAVMRELDVYMVSYDILRKENLPAISDIFMRLSNSLDMDINLYDSGGKLLLSSQPEVFERSLQSTRMNSEALIYFNENKRLRYTHQATIGELKYYSTYAPIYNNDAQLIGVVNLPYFLNRIDSRQEIFSIVTAIMNVHVLLLVLVSMIGYTLSNNILQPLQLIRRNMRRYRISNKLKYIEYDQNDEIGDLVYAYNRMIGEIEKNAKKIAQSERETAWREMARQIAHEIKNPLTPMRLSIQYLLRMKKDNVVGWQDRFDSLATSLLEQIEIMSRTASEFSDFAKSRVDMPTQIELNSILQEQQSLFDNRSNISFEIISDTTEAFVLGRRDEMTRVFVNLITNAIQAIEEHPDGRILISLKTVDEFYHIRIEDSGPGINEELQQSLFIPNFTTKSGGSGLGLAISKSVIVRIGGTIAYNKSVVLGGACFLIKLPKQSVLGKEIDV